MKCGKAIFTCNSRKLVLFYQSVAGTSRRAGGMVFSRVESTWMVVAPVKMTRRGLKKETSLETTTAAKSTAGALLAALRAGCGAIVAGAGAGSEYAEHSYERRARGERSGGAS